MAFIRLKSMANHQSFGGTLPGLRHSFSHPGGSVLVFALVIMLLMSLMGIAILANVRTELAISGNAAVGRNAFATADAAGQIATTMARILLRPDAGLPADILKESSGPAFPMKVEINSSKFNAFKLRQERTDINYAGRYVQAGSWAGRSENSQDLSPHLTFTVAGEDAEGNPADIVVATAAVAMDSKAMITPGATNGGGDAYDKTGGVATLEVLMVVTVNGRPTRTVLAGTDAKTSFDGGINEGPYSIITTIFREII